MYGNECTCGSFDNYVEFATTSYLEPEENIGPSTFELREAKADFFRNRKPRLQAKPDCMKKWKRDK